MLTIRTIGRFSRLLRLLALLLAAMCVTVIGSACGQSSGPGTGQGPARLLPSVSSLPTAMPVLGRRWRPSFQQGYGEVKPATIFNGGDPTGRVIQVRWLSWGTLRATGRGLGWYVGSSQSVAGGKLEPATVVAFNLGTCRGKLMYQAIEWFFPKYGQKFDPGTYINICTGQYVGSLH